MKHALPVCLILILLAGLSAPAASDPAGSDSAEDHLVILWTSGEKDVFTKVVFPYAMNSKKQDWWSAVTLIVWGPSAKLLSADEELQGQLRQLGEAGVQLTACKWCSDQYDVSETLAGLGIEVKYMGKPLTEFIKSEANVMVF